jgi:3-keto-5-aminohexanoate cleavage enzyme
MSIAPLPRIIVAPNGARRIKSDHPELPVTIAEIVETATACFVAGAGGIHAHVRDAEGRHVLDAGLYRELTEELSRTVPRMLVQITTEAVGRYSSAEQRELVRRVMPRAVSVALREMMADDEDEQARSFYFWTHDAGIAVQHILYSSEEVERLASLIETGAIPREELQLLFVLGRYAENQESRIEDLAPFLQAFARTGLSADWALCAFGRAETACLHAALQAGGKARVGFENSLRKADGSLAADNAERVREIAALAS